MREKHRRPWAPHRHSPLIRRGKTRPEINPSGGRHRHSSLPGGLGGFGRAPNGSGTRAPLHNDFSAPPLGLVTWVSGGEPGERDEEFSICRAFPPPTRKGGSEGPRNGRRAGSGPWAHLWTQGENEAPGEPESQRAMACGTGSEAGHLRVPSW